MDDLSLTLSEAATVLEPRITEQQLRQIIHALRIPPSGNRRNGHPGRPAPTYPWTELAGLHAALVPWLTRTLVTDGN